MRLIRVSIGFFMFFSLLIRAQADPKGDVPENRRAENGTVLGMYTLPTEFEPNLLVSLFGLLKEEGNAPSGGVLSTGTERAFITAANFPGADALIIADYDERSQLYNRVNSALIAISPTRADYLKLRGAQNVSQWQEAARSNPHGRFSDLGVLDLPEVFQSWRILMQHPAYAFLQSRQSGFSEVSYLIHDEQYDRLRRLAISDRIIVRVIDFRKSTDCTLLVQLLRYHQIQLSLVDLSNIWTDDFAGGGVLTDLALSLSAAAKENAQFLLSDDVGASSQSGWFQRGPLRKFIYGAVSIEEMSKKPLSEKVIRAKAFALALCLNLF